MWKKNNFTKRIQHCLNQTIGWLFPGVKNCTSFPSYKESKSIKTKTILVQTAVDILRDL